MPPRNVVPKPLQRPHPPLWVACSRRETIHYAARNGIGALSFSFVEPEDAGDWVKEYYDLIESDECMPAGFAVNPNVTVVLPMMCHTDEAEAIERGIDGAHFFGYSLAHYYGMGEHRPGTTSIWDEFHANRESRGFSREIIEADDAPLGVKLMQHGLGSLRGAIGTPPQITELIRRYEAVGVDQIVFCLQAGANKHVHICEALELFGREVVPVFAEEREARDAEKADRLAPAVERALARKAPPRKAPAGYVIDEPAELARAERAARAEGGARHPAGVRVRAGELADEARHALRRRGLEGFKRLVRGASDSQLERRFGNRVAQRALFSGMARQFDPRFAFGFTGDIVYELAHDGNGAAASEPDRWTIRVGDDSAQAIPGADGDPAVTFKLRLVDFARLAAEEIEPQELLFGGRFDIEGDLTVALRVQEMFGGPHRF
jgi:hypothetical protein